ncbi:MAG TPA: Spy/CpxP family protein refolding chaperone [Pyrinomonadaceae bacterium]|jgi:Spy/CpxP family protein refolding chaperone|nr:Spy/CpxP family protein refolding chaperone [Pyrinomonadaceae bacterium]
MKALTRKSLSAVWCGFVFALLVFNAPGARAQTPAATPSQTQEGTAQANPNDPATVLGQLNLSTEQVGQMRAIQGESVPQARELTQRLNRARRALDEAIYSDTVDEALIEQRARDVAEAQAALVRLRAQTELRVRRVLTLEQLQQFRYIRQQARREQRIERQLNRGVNPQVKPPGNNGNRQQRLNQRPGAPAEKTNGAQTAPAQRRKLAKP